MEFSQVKSSLSQETLESTVQSLIFDQDLHFVFLSFCDPVERRSTKVFVFGSNSQFPVRFLRMDAVLKQ